MWILNDRNPTEMFRSIAWNFNQKKSKMRSAREFFFPIFFWVFTKKETSRKLHFTNVDQFNSNSIFVRLQISYMSQIFQLSVFCVRNYCSR